MNDIFCQAVRGEHPVDKVYEDDKVLAFMDKYPKNEGHVLVIPKAHAENIYDIEEETLSQCHRVAKRIAVAAKKALKADGIIIIQANETAGLQHIFHLHVHVIPKYMVHRKVTKDPKLLAESIASNL